jgi:hypothetical protein
MLNSRGGKASSNRFKLREGMQAKGIWKQDPEAIVSIQDGWKLPTSVLYI